MTASVAVRDIERLLGAAVVTLRGRTDIEVTAPASLDRAGPRCVSFCSAHGAAAVAAIELSAAGVVLAEAAVAGSLPPDLLTRMAVLAVDRPRLRFIQLLRACFEEARETGVHPTAIVEAHCRLGRNVHIGPFAYVAADVVGDDSTIHGHAHVRKGVTVGARVIIHAGAVIGADGFGYEREADGSLHRFPHVGGLIIEDDVEIGPNTCIDRGAMEATVIRQGAKLDDLVYVAHNVVVGSHALVAGSAVLCGSSRVGARCWISAGSSVRDKVSVADDSVVGLGAAVVADVPPGTTVAGVPARPFVPGGA